MPPCPITGKHQHQRLRVWYNKRAQKLFCKYPKSQVLTNDGKRQAEQRDNIALRRCLQSSHRRSFIRSRSREEITLGHIHGTCKLLSEEIATPVSLIVSDIRQLGSTWTTGGH